MDDSTVTLGKEGRMDNSTVIVGEVGRMDDCRVIVKDTLHGYLQKSWSQESLLNDEP